MTIGEYWQFSIKDTHFKSAAELIRILVDVVSRGGNLLLNVGPDPDGIIPEPLAERVKAIGAWLAVNGESIYGASRSPLGPIENAWCTAKGNRLYIHLQQHPGAPLRLPEMENMIIGAQFLRNGETLKVDDETKTITLPETLPDTSMTVIEVELNGKPRNAP